MLRLALTPRWLALSLLLVAVLVGFLRLGIWQYDAYRGQRADGPVAAVAAVPLHEVARPGRPLAHDAVAVTAAGHYDASAQLVVAGVRQDGRSGFEVVTPLRLADGSVLVVVRGWTPAASPAAGAVPTGEVTVTGLLGPNDADVGERTDATTPAGRVITAVSTEELLRRLAYPPDRIYPGRVVLTGQVPSVAGPVEILRVPRHHSGVSAWRNLAYALQWWFFAAAAVWLWAVSLRAAGSGAGGSGAGRSDAGRSDAAGSDAGRSDAAGSDAGG